MKTFIRTSLALLALLMSLCALNPLPANASHYRSANLSYSPTGNPGEVEFRFLIAIRGSHPM